MSLVYSIIDPSFHLSFLVISNMLVPYLRDVPCDLPVSPYVFSYLCKLFLSWHFPAHSLCQSYGYMQYRHRGLHSLWSAVLLGISFYPYFFSYRRAIRQRWIPAYG